MKNYRYDVRHQRALNYVLKIEAISGMGGHRETFRAAIVLVKRFSLSPEEAFPLFQIWNQSNASPPWSDRELMHKLLDAQKAEGPEGLLLAKKEVHSSLASQNRKPSPRNVSKRLHLPAQPKPLEAWKAFYEPSTEERHVIAKNRSLDPVVVTRAVTRGLLKVSHIKGHHVYILIQDGFAQQRRMDSKPYALNGEISVKALNLTGSETKGVFIGSGLEWFNPARSKVLIVEGAIGFLESQSLIRYAHSMGFTDDDWNVIAAVNAHTRFRDNPQLLEKLRGKEALIVPDSGDKAGLKASERWNAELKGISRKIITKPPPMDCKDLGDVLLKPDSYHTYLKTLFYI